MHKKTLLQLLSLTVVWRVALLVWGSLADYFLAYLPTFPYYDSLLPGYGVGRWLYSWANFDGVHYLTIVEKGYIGTGLIQAFFPGFPILVSGIELVVSNALLSGLAVSHLFLVGLVIVWWQLLKTQRPVAAYLWSGLLILLLFPTSFFLGALYSESLFMFLVIAAFLAARKQQWWLAGVLAGLASGTRVVGIFLVPALLIEYLWQKWQLEGWQWHNISLKSLNQQDWIKLAYLMGVGSLGLVSYMVYLSTNFNDPLYFLHVQEEFGAGRSESLILYPQVVWRYLKILVTYQTFDWRYFAYIQEFVVGIAGLLGLVAALKYVRFSYVFFSLCVFILPTLTGTFSSMPRYVLASFALLMLLTELLHSRRWLLGIYLLGSSLLLLINVVLFIQGYWVA